MCTCLCFCMSLDCAWGDNVTFRYKSNASLLVCLCLCACLCLCYVLVCCVLVFVHTAVNTAPVLTSWHLHNVSRWLCQPPVTTVSARPATRLRWWLWLFFLIASVRIPTILMMFMSHSAIFVVLYHRMCLLNFGYYIILNLWCVLCFHIISRASKLRSLFV